MKVLVVTNMYPTVKHTYSGIFIKEHVESLQKAGITTDVFSTNPKRSRSAYLSDLPRLINTIKSGSYDIFHAVHTYSAIQMILARTITGLRTPILLTSHEGEALLPKGYHGSKGDLLGRIVYLKSIKRWVAEQVNEVIFVEKHIPEAIGFKGNYQIISPGVDFDLFKPLDKSECRDRLSLPQEAKILFFPANPKIPNKGFDLIQESISIVPAKLQIITGGTIPHSMMPIYINASDIVIQASAFEASPMVVKETMACNRTMIFTDVGDVKDLFDGVPGYFITSTDIIEIADKISLALKSGSSTNGRDRLCSLGFSLNQTAEKHIKLFEKLLETT